MTLSPDDLLQSILDSLDRIDHISPGEIPDIDLYMDQVTTFMGSRLRSTSRNPEEDKILTKTMINNYAKNDLLPPPIKKKYSKEHVLLLIFIYYYKGVLSINDIQTVLEPLTNRYFQQEEGFKLEDVYNEVFSLAPAEIEKLKLDIKEKYQMSQNTFGEYPEEDQDFLHLFAFICMLSFDVYIKKLLIEKLIDSCNEKNAQARQKKGEYHDQP